MADYQPGRREILNAAADYEVSGGDSAGDA